MLEAIHIGINGVWKILSINIPVSNSINFKLWQFYTFIIVMIVLIRQLFNTGGRKE